MGLALVLGSGTTVGAQEAGAVGAAASPSPVAIRWNVEIIGAGRTLSPTETTFNAGNRVLQMPSVVGMIDVRGNVRLEIGSRTSVVLRPRVRGSIERVAPDGLPARADDDADAQVTEAFATWRPLDTLSITYGLQNFQWGPAELVSPSNRVFHETGLFRDPLYSVRGKHLLRANVSVGRQWSLVALAEVSHNGAGADEAFQAGVPFARQGLAKFEFTTADGGSHVGASGGAVERGRPWVGAYGMWMLSDAVALYADASATRGSAAWYPAPVAAPGRPAFVAAARGVDAWRAMVVGGLRYTFTRGDEARLEYFHQDAGYTDAQMIGAVTTVVEARDAEQFRRFLAPGLEFVGRDLALVSLRLPDLPPAKRSTMQLRYLGSATDGSGVVFASTTVNATDAAVVFVTAALTHGASSAEFSRLARSSVTAGLVYAF